MCDQREKTASEGEMMIVSRRQAVQSDGQTDRRQSGQTARQTGEASRRQVDDVGSIGSDEQPLTRQPAHP